MDRRNALLALFVLVLFGCDDGYDPCEKSGCDRTSSDRRSASWSASQVKVSGSVTIDGDAIGIHAATQSGFTVSVPPSFSTDDASSESDGALDGGSDADADADASEADPGNEGRSGFDPYEPSYDTTKRLRVEIDAERPPGMYRLEAVHAFAMVCAPGTGLGSYGDTCTDRRGKTSAPERVALEGTLEVIDVQVAAAEGAPTSRPYELPWGWAVKTTNENLVVDVRAVSRPTWHSANGYCD